MYTAEALAPSIRTSQQTTGVRQSISLDPILTGNLLKKKGDAAFVIDLQSLVVSSTPMPLTWDHDQLIGHVTSVMVDDKANVVRGFGDIISYVTNDLAADVINRLRGGEVTLGLSPDLDETEAHYQLLTAGETAQVNGQTITGPAAIIYQTRIVGVAITPYPTDLGTDLKLLHRAILELSQNGGSIMTEENKVPSEGGDEMSTKAHPDLEAYIDQFGLDLGVQYYRDGLTPEEAKDKFIAESAARLQAANDEIKRLSQTEQKKEEEQEPPTDSPEAVKDEEIRKLSRECASLRNETHELSKVVTTLRQTVRFGEAVAVPENSRTAKVFTDPISRQADRISGQLRK